MNILDLTGLPGRTAQKFGIDPAGLSGGQSLFGLETTVSAGAALWRGQVTHVARNGDEKRMWRAIAAQLRGRQTRFRLMAGPCLGADMLARFAAPGAATLAVGRPHALGQLFAHGRGYATPWPAFVTVGTAAPLTAVVRVERGALAAGFRVGDKLTIAGRLHMITGFANSGTQTTLMVEPPFRVTIPAGAAVSMRPTLVATLTADDMAQLDDDFARPARVTLECVEDPDFS